jgi:tetratricopeptide (TPR) repeat protein
MALNPKATPTQRSHHAFRSFHGKSRLYIAIYLVLAAVVVWVYAPVRHYPFINLDDPDYVYMNPQVQSGLTADNVAWAFKSGFASNWHPVTWLSLMLDRQLFGVDAGAYHMSNVAIHALNTVLLFLLWFRMTNYPWRSAAVAALFALHPLRLESVVWVSERKDLLCGLFWLLTTWMYVQYARHRNRRARTTYYIASLIFFSLGLMSKPMMVTLPCVLILLDFWPLQRVQWSKIQLRGAVVEKLPFFGLAVISSVITVIVQTHARASLESVPMTTRLGNAVVSYQRYLHKIFWPSNLAVFYPHPGRWPIWYVCASLIVVAGVSWWVVQRSRTHICMAIGWLWFVAVLLPVIGLVQAGSQSMADRFTYIPAIGIAIMLVWGVAEWSLKTKSGRVIGPAFVGLLVIFCALSTRAQLKFWRDNETLYSRAIAVTRDNNVAYINRGYEFASQKRYAEAIADFESVLRHMPDNADALANRGTAYAKQGAMEKAFNDFVAALKVSPTQAGANNGMGRLLEQGGHYDVAIPYFQRALAAKPNFADAESNWGYALAAKGDVGAAISHYEKALRMDGNNAEAHNNLGIALAQLDRVDEAATHLAKAVALDPKDAQAQNNYANVLAGAGRLDEAAAHYQQALKLKPDYLSARSNFGRILTRQKKWDQAIVEFEAAHKVDSTDSDVMDALAGAYAERGKFADATAMASNAVQLCERLGQTEKATKIRERLLSYQRGQVSHQ